MITVEEVGSIVALDDVIVIQSQEDRITLAMNGTPEEIEEMREKYAWIFSVPVQIDHIEQHANRKSALEALQRENKKKLDEIVERLSKSRTPAS